MNVTLDIPDRANLRVGMRMRVLDEKSLSFRMLGTIMSFTYDSDKAHAVYLKIPYMDPQTNAPAWKTDFFRLDQLRAL